MVLRDRGDDLLELGAVGDVAGDEPGLAASLLQLRLELRGPVGLGPAPTDQRQVTDLAGGEVACHHRSQPSGPTGEENRSLRIQRLRDREDDLADVAPVAQITEGLAGATDVPRRDRLEVKCPRCEKVDQLAQDLVEAIHPRFAEIERSVADAGMGRDDRFAVANVGLAHLDEAAAVRQEVQRGIDEVAGERVQHHVNALTRGRGEELLPEP
jgi:hypothetical protein